MRDNNSRAIITTVRLADFLRLSSGIEIKHRTLRVRVAEDDTTRSLTKRHITHSPYKIDQEKKQDHRVTARRNCTLPLECV